MGYGDFPDFGKMLIFLIIVLAVAVPLAIWKLVELILYIINHLHWA